MINHITSIFKFDFVCIFHRMVHYWRSRETSDNDTYSRILIRGPNNGEFHFVLLCFSFLVLWGFFLVLRSCGLFFYLLNFFPALVTFFYSAFPLITPPFLSFSCDALFPSFYFSLDSSFTSFMFVAISFRLRFYYICFSTGLLALTRLIF